MNNLLLDNAKKNIEKVDFSILKNKRVLLTGCTGLIGINLLASLKLVQKQYNIQIFCLTNSYIDELFVDLFDDCIVIKSDITQDDGIDSLLNIFSEEQNGVDYIIHSAGYAQPKKFTKDKVNTILLNTKTTINLFKLLNFGGNFLFLSSTEVYSGLYNENLSEEMIGNTNPEHPRSCYIESKRCGESIVHSFRENGYNAKIARIGFCYGPGTKKSDSRVLSNFIQKSFEEKKINLLDSGDSIRTHCYISDTTEMIWNILLYGKESVYNVSGISKISIYELAIHVGKLMNCSVNKSNDNTNEMIGNPKMVSLCLNKYFQEFGKKEFVSLEQGLLNTIKWQEQFYI